MTNYIAPAAAAAAIAALLGGTGCPAPAHADPSLAGDYTLFWEPTESLFGEPDERPDPDGQTHHVRVTSCGPDCLMWNNLDHPGPPQPFTRAGDGWKNEPRLIEQKIRCADGSLRSSAVTWYVDDDFSKTWSDWTAVDCGHGPVKPRSDIGRLTRS